MDKDHNNIIDMIWLITHTQVHIISYDEAIIYGYHSNNSYFPIAQGDIRISGGGKSGLLQYDKGDDDWGAICKSGFDDDTAVLACYQLGYKRSTDNFIYS